MSSRGEVLAYLEELAPSALAADWDNVGLLLGERDGQVDRLMTCLSLTATTAAEAVECQAQLIVTHHPILFRPIKRLTADNPEGRMLLELVRAGVAVYSPHTAFDNIPNGINDRLGQRLGLQNLRPLRSRSGAGQCKLVTFVPDADLNRVADAVFAAGAGHIGQYRECSFRLAGTGTFFGSEATNPTIGQKGRREELQEWRLEVICPEQRMEAAIKALRKAHSYEEPAFDIYPLRSPPGNQGEGRVGDLPGEHSLRRVAGGVKELLRSSALQVVGDPDRPVRRVALACGAAGEFLMDAVRANADLFITGEARFHDCLAAQAHKIALCVAGHYATERFAVEELAEILGQQFPRIVAWASTREADPLLML